MGSVQKTLIASIVAKYSNYGILYYPKWQCHRSYSLFTFTSKFDSLVSKLLDVAT